MTRRNWIAATIAAAALLFIVIPVCVIAIGLAMAFADNLPATDGEQAADGRVTLVQDSYANLFIVDVGDGVALVDAGLSPESAAAALARHGVAPEEVLAVFLTHGHGDHTGGLSAFPDARIYALATEQALLEGSVAPRSPIGWLAGAHDSGAELERALTDGERVWVGDVEVQAFAVPGHTAGSAAYLARGVLFLGDSAGASAGGGIHGSPWIFSDDVPRNHASLHALAARIDTTSLTGLAFGHTGMLAGGSDLARFAEPNP